MTEILDSNSYQEIGSVSGDHMEGKTNLDVEYLYMAPKEKQLREGIKRFPKGIGKFLPNLIGLTVKASLDRVTNEDLKGFPKLKILLLAGNRLTALDSNLFEEVPALEYLHLAHNKILDFGHDILKPLKHLKRVYVYNNVCMDKDQWSCEPNSKKWKELEEKMNENCPPDEVIDGSVEMSTEFLLE